MNILNRYIDERSQQLKSEEVNEFDLKINEVKTKVQFE